MIQNRQKFLNMLQDYAWLWFLLIIIQLILYFNYYEFYEFYHEIVYHIFRLFNVFIDFFKILIMEVMTGYGTHFYAFGILILCMTVGKIFLHFTRLTVRGGRK